LRAGAKSRQAPKQTPIHLLMRFSDRMGFTQNTIAAHREVIQKRGATWLGKMGKTLGLGKVARINRQCRDRVPTFIYLVQKAPGGYQVYCGKISEVRRKLPPGGRRLVPEYYEANGLEKFMRLWIKLSSLHQVSSFEIADYVISSSGMPTLSTLGRSMAALFVVRSKHDESSEGYGKDEDDNDEDWDF
jgi:hypothetical protein